MKSLLSGSLFLLLAMAPALSDGPFVDMKFDDALKKAAQEKKIVLVDFYTTWCVPCKLLDKNTWTDADVIKLLQDKTVPLKIDAEKETKLAAKYKIGAYPTILLLNPDGTEIDRLVGYLDPKPFIANFNDSLNGKDSVIRARDAVAKAGGNDPMSRESLGTALARKQKYADALEEYLWCFDHGAEANPGYVGVRLSFLLSDIVTLGKNYPPALQALEARRDDTEKKILAGSTDGMTVQEVVRLNDSLNQKEKTLALFDKLPPKFRGILVNDVVDSLIAAKRYQDVLDNADPEAAFEQQIQKFKLRMSLLEKSPNKGIVEQIMTEQIVSSCTCYFEALAGTGKDGPAMALAAKILQFSNTPETRSHLIQSAQHAGNTGIAARLKSAGS